LILAISNLFHVLEYKNQISHIAGETPFKLYNVKRGVWHSHTFSADAKVLIVENRDTVDATPFVGLTEEQRKQIAELTNRFWK
jgi:hypothetical protein